MDLPGLEECVAARRRRSAPRSERCAARWTLTAANGVTEDTNRLTVRPASDSDADLVAAMSQALGLLADKIAATFAR